MVELALHNAMLIGVPFSSSQECFSAHRQSYMYLLTLDIVVASVAMQTDTGTFYSKCDSRLFD